MGDDSARLETLFIEGRQLVGSSVLPLHSDARQALERLIYPLPLDKFLSEVWGKRHHLIKRTDPTYFAGLFDPDDVERHLDFCRPESGELRLGRNGIPQPFDRYRQADGRVDLVRLRNDFASGHTIVLNKLEGMIPSIATLARQIEMELNFNAAINAYISPPHSQGFPAHSDDHDVLILQIKGSKEWQIHESAAQAPDPGLTLRANDEERELPTPVTLELSAGDILYIPGGCIHSAKTATEASTHLTIGIYPPNVVGLLNKILEALSCRESSLRERLPPRFLTDLVTRASLEDLVVTALSLLDDQALEEGIGSIEDQLIRRGRCQQIGNLLDGVSTADQIDGASWMERSPFILTRVLTFGGGVALQFAQCLLSASLEFREALLYIAHSAGPFRVSELPGLPEIDQVRLAHRLAIDGFLKRVAE